MKNDESVLVHIRGKDCVAIEACYHKKCYQRYTKNLSNMINAKPVDVGQECSIYDKAFDIFSVDIIENRIIANKEILLLSYLLKIFIELVRDVGGDTVPYQAARLRKRIESRYPQVVFHASKTMKKGTLVYSGDIETGEIADQMDIDLTNSEDDDDDVDEVQLECNAGERMDRSVRDTTVQELFHVAMEINGMLKKSSGVDGWPPDSSDLTLDHATESIPVTLFNFIAWTLGYSGEPVVDERVVISRSQRCKIVSIIQDLVYAEAKGKKQTHKSLALGMTVRQISGSTKLLNILHGLGHSASSSTVCKHDSALAEVNNTSSNVIIPRSINVGRFTTIVWDNNDFNEETLTGAGTTHVTNGIVIQRGEPAMSSKVAVSKKLRTVKVVDHDIQPYIGTKKGVPSLRQDIDTNNNQVLQIPGRNLDFAYIVCRLCSFDIGKILPGWTGFNTQLTGNIPDTSLIGYLPVINSPATDLATVNEMLKRSVSISQRLDVPEIVLVFDEAIYAKAQMIRWKEDELTRRIVIRLGEFHTVMSYCSAIGKIFKDAGLKVNVYLPVAVRVN